MDSANQSEPLPQKILLSITTRTYLIISAMWFVITMLLIIFTYEAEKTGGWFSGLTTVLAAFLCVCVGIPFLVVYVYNMILSIYYLSVVPKNKKALSFISSIVPMVYYYIFACFVIYRLQYIYTYEIVLITVLFVLFFVVLFSYPISILFNLKKIWVKLSRYINIVLVLLSVATVFFGYIPIARSDEIYDSKRIIWAEQADRMREEYRNSLFTYTYTDNYEENGVEIDITIQFLSPWQSSDEFLTNGVSSGYIYLTKKSIFLTSDVAGDYINGVINDDVKNTRNFAEVSAYSYEVEANNGEIVSVTEFFSLWSPFLDGDEDYRDNYILSSLDARFMTLEDFKRINEKGLSEKLEQGDRITFNGRVAETGWQ